MRAIFKPVAMATVMVAGLLAAGAASAQIAVSGGATLPQPLYNDILPYAFGVGGVSYTGTGSGTGKTAFFNNNATLFRDETQASRPAWPATQSVHFVGSDSALTATELSSYNSAHLSGWGRLIQIPAVATSVLLPFTRSGATALNLPTAKVCAIFGNKAGGQTWGDILGNSDTTPIAVVYRTDTSGTTELLSRFLAGACGSGSGFVVSNSFATAVGGAVGTIPANWVGVSGSPAVNSALATDARLGYLSPDSQYTGIDATKVAKINGNLPDPDAIRTVLSAQSLPVGGAPANPLAWVPTYSVPTSGYPIFGTTNLLINQCYKDAGVQAKIVTLLNNLYNTLSTDPDSQTTAKIKSHNFVTLPDDRAGNTNNWKLAIKNTFLNSSNSLGIGNTNVCNGIGRPLQN
ncbi:MAG TPA: substrate-binding domain-containing protein [Variovorax sp.]